jgi:hypothetical protein
MYLLCMNIVLKCIPTPPSQIKSWIHAWGKWPRLEESLMNLIDRLPVTVRGISL